ncbi:unnamed protein product [Lactuca virosa]|uniref:Uncharacterized protein n=1 Tax=Lactuca virosa TaxID=75947 RepID=A0AAU9NT96_9ASTR|nr:unnamed protein product [Lactuca virosa]
MVVCCDPEWVSSKCDSHRAKMATHMREMVEEQKREKRFVITGEGRCTTAPTSALTPVFAGNKHQSIGLRSLGGSAGRKKSVTGGGGREV